MSGERLLALGSELTWTGERSSIASVIAGRAGIARSAQTALRVRVTVLTETMPK